MFVFLLLIVAVVVVVSLKLFVERKKSGVDSSYDENSKVQAGDSLEQKRVEDTTNRYIVHDKYGNALAFQTQEQAKAYEKLQENIPVQTSSSVVNTDSEITKSWYSKVGQETAETTTDYDQDFGDGSFLADCGTYYDAVSVATPVPDKNKVKKYLPKPAEDKYTTSKTVAPKQSKMLYFVSVKFDSNRNEYDYICDDRSVKFGDVVLVPAQGEVKQARVTRAYYQNISKMPLPEYRYKKVISKCGEQAKSKGRYAMVQFSEGGKEYTYKCDLPSVLKGSFVRVVAQNKEKTVKVTAIVYESPFKVKSKVLRFATATEIDRWYQGEEDESYSYSNHRYKEKKNPYEQEMAKAARAQVEQERTNETRPKTESEKLWDIYYNPMYAMNPLNAFYDDDEKPKKNNNSMTDERGFMRDGKAEYLEEQLEKAKRLGRLTDDRGFIIDEYYVRCYKEKYFDEDYDDEGNYVRDLIEEGRYDPDRGYIDDEDEDEPDFEDEHDCTDHECNDYDCGSSYDHDEDCDYRQDDSWSNDSDSSSGSDDDWNN